MREMWVGEERGADAGRRGRDVGAAATAEFFCAVNLTKTFEKAKSQRERHRRRSAALQTAGAETVLFLYFFTFYFILFSYRSKENK